MIHLNQGCPTFFHNGPNYKFKYIQRAAKLHEYKISSFGIRCNDQRTCIEYKF